MLLDLDVPQALDALLLAVVVALVAWLVAVEFGNAQREEREREQFECVFGGCAVGDFGEEGVLGARFLVGGGLEGADGALDWVFVNFCYFCWTLRN